MDLENVISLRAKRNEIESTRSVEEQSMIQAMYHLEMALDMDDGERMRDHMCAAHYHIQFVFCGVKPEDWCEVVDKFELKLDVLDGEI